MSDTQEVGVEQIEALEIELDKSVESETPSPIIESNNDEESYHLEPEVRVGIAVYLVAMNTGVVTPSGVVLPNAMNMTQIAKQAEVSVNYAIKALANIRKLGFVKNRKDDGRLLIKFSELEEWLESKGMALNNED